MALSKDGDRPRFFLERKKLTDRQGDPLHDDVTKQARDRICREISARAWFHDRAGNVRRLNDTILSHANRVFQRSWRYHFTSIESDFTDVSRDEFLQFIEISISVLLDNRKDPLTDIDVINSLLADDFSMFRIVDVRGQNPPYQIHKIDNEHLHAAIADRTFELTGVAEFAAAQGDYADAWRHYSKGDLDDAVVNAHKAVESASKVVIKRLDPTSDCEQKQMNQLVPELVRLDVLPSRIQNVVSGLNHIFINSGSLRNQAGVGHGGLNPTSPEATTALLALRLSGSLIAFLAERWTQMKS